MLGATACVSHTDFGVDSGAWQSMSLQQKKALQENYLKIQAYQQAATKTSGKQVLRLSVWGGKAKMPPDFDVYAFNKVSIYLHEGSCQDLWLNASEGKHQGSVRACYLNTLLSLDPSRTNPADWQGTVFFHYNPVWDHGFTYHSVSSSGYAGLSNASVRVQVLPDLIPPGEAQHG